MRRPPCRVGMDIRVTGSRACQTIETAAHRKAIYAMCFGKSPESSRRAEVLLVNSLLLPCAGSQEVHRGCVFQAASHGSVLQGAEIRDQMGKGLCWARLGRLIHIQHDSESHLLSVGGRKLAGSGGGGCGSSAQVAQSLG